MCLVVLALQAHPDYPLVVAANRDEFYARPTQAAGFWPDDPELLAGRDLQAGGTWLGITRQGRFAAVTNVRDGRIPRHPEHRSRGDLTRQFLQGSASPTDYLEQLQREADQFGAFNLLLGFNGELWFYSNQDHQRPKLLAPGIYSLSNATLDTPWPKTVRARTALERVMRAPDPAALEKLLLDSKQAADKRLPNTHIDIVWERLLSSCFIRSTDYGTRASTILLQERQGRVRFIEQNFDIDGPTERRGYEFNLVGPTGG